MARGLPRLTHILIYIFVFLQLSLCLPSPPADGKRPLTSGEGAQPPPKKAKKPVTPEMSIKEVMFPQSSGQRSREIYFRKFTAQKGVAPHAFNKQGEEPPTFTAAEIKDMAMAHFKWVTNQDEADKPEFWGYQMKGRSGPKEDKWVCTGNMVSVTWSMGVGIGASTIPPGYMQASYNAKILSKQLKGDKLHAEDGTYIEIEENAKFPAEAEKYPQPTINYSYGYPPSSFVSTQVVRGTNDEAYGKGCLLKHVDGKDVDPVYVPPCSLFSGRSKSCTAIGEALGVEFVR